MYAATVTNAPLDSEEPGNTSTHPGTAIPQRLTFDVNCVYRRNMIMRDRETGSLWQQATGECLIGPLKGATLALLPGELTTWGSFKQDYPDTDFALEPERWTGILPKHVVHTMLDKATSGSLAPGQVLLDKRLDPTAEVVGLVLRGEARAWPVQALTRLGVCEDTLGGIPIRLEASADGARIRAYDLSNPSFPTALTLTRGRWLGWQEFHPQTSRGLTELAP